MSTTVKPIPEGYSTITPYLTVCGGGEAIEFYKKVFGAKEVMRMPQPDGKIGHAELNIGDSKIMLADECDTMKSKSAKTLGGSPVTLHVYVANVDNTVNEAIAAGATVLHPVSDKFYGDRSGTVKDPFGHIWHVSTHIEDVSPQEMERRMKAMQSA